MSTRLEEVKKITIEGETIEVAPEDLLSYNNDEERTTHTYLYHVPEQDVFVLQVHHNFMNSKDEFQILDKTQAQLRHDKNHPNKLSELV